MKQTQDNVEKLTILIIEDNQGDFVLIEDYLLEKFKDISIIHYSNYESSINYLQNSKNQISLILMDLNLPDLGGIELINGILGYDFDIPIIILTGFVDQHMAKRSLQLGIYDYLVKDEINPIVLHKTIVFSLNRSSFVSQIEHEKENYENLFNFNPQPTWLLDSKSLRIINANNAAQKKYGFSSDDFLKMSFTQLHPPEEEQTIKNKFISREDDSSISHFTHFLSDGKKIKVEIYFKEINTNNKSRIIVQSNDVSETLRHIDTIEIQNAKLRKIAWTQSHVVRTPISRILGIINLIEEEGENFDEILFWLKQLKIS